MSIHFNIFVNFIFAATIFVTACTSSRQIAVDFPSAEISDGQTAQTSQSQSLKPVPGFQFIDGDDYYIRLISEFDFKGDAIQKSGCSSMAPSYEKNDLSSALIFSVRNDILKLSNDAPGFSYQAATGKCNFKFEAKKLFLTPWMRLDTGKETTVDYSFVSSDSSNVDVSRILGDVTAAGTLLSFTGVGMGVAIMGQYAGQWAKNTQQVAPASTVNQANAASLKNSSESHTLPDFVTFSGKTGSLNKTVFKVYAVEQGGINLLGPNSQVLGELKIYPEIISTLLLKPGADGVPDARDLTYEEIGYSPIKSANGQIKLLQLIEQSKHPAKPDLKPKWSNYSEVESNCRKIKLVMKDLGFNKFDRNAFIYYFLANSDDWKNYNISRSTAMNGDLNSKVLDGYRSKDFGNCLNADDYLVMKAMGLAVNSQSDWDQMNASSQKKEQSFMPLKSIERQLTSVLKNPNVAEMERQLYPLISTVNGGDGTVLLQNHLGDLGLEALLNTSADTAPTPAAGSSQFSAPAAAAAAVVAGKKALKNAPPPANVLPVAKAIPGGGLIISAKQLAQVFSGLLINELSCARPAPQLQGSPNSNEGILLFTTNAGSPQSKGGAMEFEFAAGKINRIAFQLPAFRDFAQDLIDHPEVGGCRIDPAFIKKLH